MNQPLFLHIVERLEGFLGKLPESIQKPVLKELTPMKELFLKQRPPRFVLTGSHKLPLQEVVATLFAAAQPGDLSDVLMEVFRWHSTNLGEHGSVDVPRCAGADAGRCDRSSRNWNASGRHFSSSRGWQCGAAGPFARYGDASVARAIQHVGRNCA